MRKKIIPFLATAVGAVASLGLGTQPVSDASPAEPVQEVASVTTRNSSTRQSDNGTNNKVGKRTVGLRGMNFNYNNFGGDYSQLAKDPGCHQSSTNTTDCTMCFGTILSIPNILNTKNHGINAKKRRSHQLA